MRKGNHTGAWLLCEDLLLKIKEAIVEEASGVLHREIEEDRIKLSADWVNMESQNEALERDMFLINNLLAEAPEMLWKQDEYIRAKETSGAKLDADTVAKIESIKKLSLAISYISVLMEHTTVIDNWVKDIEQMPLAQDPTDLLKSTLNNKRLELLKFFLKSKQFGSSLLSKEEFSMLSEVTCGQPA